MIRRSIYVLGATLLVSAPATASETHRLAFSKKMGIEVLANKMSGKWCGETVALTIRAKDQTFFAKSSFKTLMAQLGFVLSKDCPEAKSASVVGESFEAKKVLFTGTASAADKWSPIKKIQSARTNVPPPPKTQTIKAQVPSWLGEWKGKFGCNNDTDIDVTLSIYSIKNALVNGVVDVEQSVKGDITNTRFLVSGSTDPATGTFKFDAGDWVARPGYGYDSASLYGTSFLNKNKMDVRISYKGCSKSTLTRVSNDPILVTRINTHDQWAKNFQNQLFNAPIPGHQIGSKIGGKFRKPSCKSLIDWTKSHPTGVRFRFTEGGIGILRHFDDDTTIKHFSKSAYFWNQNQWQQVKKVGRDCRWTRNISKQDKNLINFVVVDRNSERVINQRLALLKNASSDFVGRFTRGSEPAIQYSILHSLSSTSKQKSAFKGISLQSDATFFVEYIDGFKAAYLTNVLSDALQRMQNYTRTKIGLKESISLHALVEKSLGQDLSPTERIKLQTALDTHRKDVAKTLVPEEIARIAGHEAKLENMISVDTSISELKDLLGENAGAIINDLDTARDSFFSRARKTIIQEETDKIGVFPETLKGLTDLRAHKDHVLVVVGDTPPLPERQQYALATERKIAAIEATLTTQLIEKMKALSVSWGSLDHATEITGELMSKKLGNDNESRLKTELDNAHKRLLDGLTEEATNKLSEMAATSVTQTIQIFDAMKVEAEKFRKFGALTHATQVEEFGMNHTNKLFASSIELAKSGISKLEPSRSMISRMDTSIAVIDKRLEELPALKPYRLLLLASQKKMYAKICKSAYDKADLSTGDQDVPILVGTTKRSLGTFTCTLDAAGIEVTKYKSPGLGSSLFGGEEVHKIQLFHKPSQKMMNLELKMVEAKPNQKMLVGTQKGDASTMSPIGTEDWSILSGLMWELGKIDGIGATERCKETGGKRVRLKRSDNSFFISATGIVDKFPLLEAMTKCP